MKDDPGGAAPLNVIVIQDASSTDLAAGENADKVEAPAAQDFLRDLNVVIHVPGYEVQRLTGASFARAAILALIAPPKRILD
jgi:hypothetical protein